MSALFFENLPFEEKLKVAFRGDAKEQKKAISSARKEFGGPLFTRLLGSSRPVPQQQAAQGALGSTGNVFKSKLGSARRTV